MKRRNIALLVIMAGFVLAISSQHSFAFQSSQTAESTSDSAEPDFPDEPDLLIEDESDSDDEGEVTEEEKRTREITKQYSIDNYLNPVHELKADDSVLLPDVVDKNKRPESRPSTTELSSEYWPEPSCLRWQRPDTIHRYNYFEDRSLERCGYSRADFWQAPASATKFIFQATTFPLHRVRSRDCYLRNYYYAPDCFRDPTLSRF